MSTRLTLDNIRGVAWATPCPVPWGIFLLAGLLTLVQEEKNDFAYIHAPQIAYYGTYLLPFKFSKNCEPGLRRSILCESRQADRPTLQLRYQKRTVICVGADSVACGADEVWQV